MKEQLRREWINLMQEGALGQATRFRLRGMRLAQLLGKLDPELADALVKGLGSTGDLTRLHSPVIATDAPELLNVEAEPQLSLQPYWPASVQADLQQILVEWAGREVLVDAGLPPVQTVLLHGPPGVGKTLAARWLAQQLQLPLATLDLAATMNSYLGKTGQNISRVLDYARTRPCVLLLDEFDALAKRRADDQDVGELKRVVNVLLQAVDQWNGPSLLVAATNHVDLLDTAIIRRFELAIEFKAASSEQIAHILKSLGVPGKLASALSLKLQGQPISNATRMVTAARKRQVLEKITFEGALNVAAEELRAYQSPVQRRRTQVKSLTSAGMSSHQIAKRLGISHTTVLRDLKASGEE